MNTDLEQQTYEALKQSKEKLRHYLRNLSPTEKIRQLELLQKRNYEILKELEKSEGRKVPEKWRKWREAQDF